jgi:hypothetical protein
LLQPQPQLLFPSRLQSNQGSDERKHRQRALKVCRGLAEFSHRSDL